MPVFFFTDIEGSTGLWEKHHDSMGPVIARHFQILEEQVGWFGGEVVKHTGDGIFAVFHKPEELEGQAHSALQCALGIQRQIQAEPWPLVGELRVRLALHCGSAEKMSGDYYGPTANRTARFMTLGWGGQILISDDLKQAGGLPEEASLADLGVHQVKDLPEPQQIWGLLHPGLKFNRFPPLKSLSDSPHNLPSQPFDLVGRTQELATLSGLVAQPTRRLIVLRGPGGIGKSRLGLQAGWQALKKFKHGIWLVSLEGVEKASGAVARIGEALRLPLADPSHGVDQAQLQEYLKERECLLILDPCDKLAASPQLLADLLKDAPGLKILAASRQSIPLSLATEVELAGLETAAKPGEASPAAQHFLDRARLARADFQLQAGEQDLLAGLCRKLDGLPLALELAASWLKTLPFKEVVRRVDANLALLFSPDKDLPERQRSLKAVFESSWNLLPEDLKEACRRLSVFRGGFTAEAAQEAAQAGPEKLAGLQRVSLLRRLKNGRWEMPEFQRPFALAKLALAAGDKEKVLSAHARHFLSFLAARESSLLGPGQPMAVAELRSESGNLSQAWHWACENSRTDLLEAAGLSLGLFSSLSGSSEGEALLAQALSLPESSSSDKVPRLLAGQALLSARRGKLRSSEASAQLEKCAHSLKKSGALSLAAFLQGRRSLLDLPAEKKTGALEEAASLYRQAKDGHGSAWVKAWQAILQARSTSDPAAREEALARARENLAVLKENSSRELEGQVLQALGMMDLKAGRREAGLAQCQEARKAFVTLGDWEDVAGLCTAQARFLNGQGDWKTALPLAEEALGIRKALGQGSALADAFRDLAEVERALGKEAGVLTLLEFLLAPSPALDLPPAKRAWLLWEKARTLLQKDGPEAAIPAANECQRAFEAAGEALGSLEVLELQASLAEAGKAAEILRQTHAQWSTRKDRGREAWACVRLADVSLKAGRQNEALREYGNALALAEPQAVEDFSAGALLGLARVSQEEKRPLEAARLAMLARHFLESPGLAVHQQDYTRQTRLGLKALEESLSAKLMQDTFAQAKGWAEGVETHKFFRELVDKYCR
jgi:predicted ATPase/class 3 adenylate cyclase